MNYPYGPDIFSTESDFALHRLSMTAEVKYTNGTVLTRRLPWLKNTPKPSANENAAWMGLAQLLKEYYDYFVCRKAKDLRLPGLKVQTEQLMAAYARSVMYRYVACELYCCLIN